MLNVKKLLTKICSAIGFYKETTMSTSYGTAYIAKTFNTITVRFEGTSNALPHSQYTKLFTLSANDKPLTMTRFVGYDNNTSDVAKVPLTGYINAQGECYLWVYGNSGTNVAPRFHVTYVRTGSLV